MVTLSYSQNSYPQKIVFNGDSLILITIPQLELSNEKMLLGEYYFEKLKIGERTITFLNNKAELLGSVISNKDSEILSLKLKENKIVESYDLRIENIIKENRKKNRKMFFTGAGTGAVVMVILAILL